MGLLEIGSGLGKAILGFKKGMAKPGETDLTPQKDSSNDNIG